MNIDGPSWQWLGLGPRWRLRRQTKKGNEITSESGAGPVEVETAPGKPETESPLLASTERPDIEKLDWSQLIDAIETCRSCALCRQRTQTVPGVGDREAACLFIGEGPGAEEDQRGEPFVGKAGQLLDAMLQSIGFSRGYGVYITNTVKCRPPDNRTPEAGELAACWPFLDRQIELIQPRLIVALGRPAAQVLLQQEIRISSIRGHIHHYKGVPLIVTYHPAYLLRNQPDKAKAWEDLCLVRQTLTQLDPPAAEGTP